MTLLSRRGPARWRGGSIGCSVRRMRWWPRTCGGSLPGPTVGRRRSTRSRWPWWDASQHAESI